MNEQFWSTKKLPLQQEIVFASTGKKLEWQSDDYYVEHLAGGGIQTNPPETNEAVEAVKKKYEKRVDQLPPKALLDEIDKKVDVARLEAVLLKEGTAKFADAFKGLLSAIKKKRESLTS
jgi:transaldolase